MFCTQCGTQLSDSAAFCTACGRSTTAVAVPRQPLRRLMAEKKIAGVCAGLAEYFDTDVTLMRIIWLVLLLVPPGIGFVAYIVAIFAMPKSYEPRAYIEGPLRN